ncbi:4'-phosphopantetheinyl transferase superfamily protein [Candidatus Bipolaricaulota bacterium]|nr:4'-phosphopantetheinyl transferase superfamily protein [Candidatus Bipolaricaulota bacterium]
MALKRVGRSEDVIRDFNAPAPGEVHVWRMALAAEPSEIGRLFSILSEAERARINRQPRDTAQRARIVCWGRTREILAGTIGCLPTEVSLRHGRTVKPTHDTARTDMRFSLSHSGDWALLAVTHGIDVGIDIERIRRGADVHRLAERFFTSLETQQLLEHEERARRDAFFRIWTCKEALIKALGLGVPSALGSFSVLRRADGRLVAEPEDPDDERSVLGWKIVEPPAPAGYAAAIAVATEEPLVRVFDVPQTAPRRVLR